VVEENRKTAKQLLDRKNEQLAALFPAGVTGSTTLPKTPFRAPQPRTTESDADHTPTSTAVQSVLPDQDAERDTDTMAKPASLGSLSNGDSSVAKSGGERIQDLVPCASDHSEREREIQCTRQHEKEQLDKMQKEKQNTNEGKELKTDAANPALTPPILSRGNTHLQTTWGKPQPKRSAVSFRIGNEKVEMPLLTVPRAQVLFFRARSRATRIPPRSGTRRRDAPKQAAARVWTYPDARPLRRSAPCRRALRI